MACLSNPDRKDQVGGVEKCIQIKTAGSKEELPQNYGEDRVMVHNEALTTALTCVP